MKPSDDELKDLIQKADAATPDTIKSLVTELLELRESDRRKTEALEFYARGEHRYCWCFDETDEEYNHKHDWQFEDGEKARAALGEKE